MKNVIIGIDITDIKNGRAYESPYAPIVWKQYIDGCKISPLSSRAEKYVKTKEEQLPTDKVQYKMLQTLQNGNKVIVTGLDYNPEVGDIIVISHGAELDKALVKRIIAVEGQTVDINSETGEVSVNNIVLDEPYINGKTVAQGDMEFPLQVTEGNVFVLGDNRPISKDSRYKEVGLIDKDSIIGKVQLRIYPFSEFGKVD